MSYIHGALHVVADRLEQLDENGFVESAALREAADYITKLEKALETYEKERVRFRHTRPELTGAYFISGEGGSKDKNMLPDVIYICPAYGCDWSQKYVRAATQV